MRTRTLVVDGPQDVDAYMDATPIATRRHRSIIVLGFAGIAFESYFVGSVSAGIGSLTKQLDLSAGEVGFITAFGYFGAILLAAFGGRFADRFGRVPLMVFAKFLAAAGVVVMMLARNYETLVFGRLLTGAAYGIDLGVAMAYLAEFLPTKRKSLLNYWQAQWYVSTVLALAATLLFYAVDTGPNLWRWGLGSAAVFALVVGVLQLRLPESPRWLAQQGRFTDAARSLGRVYGVEADVSGASNDASARPGTDKARLKDLFAPEHRARTLLSATVQATQSIQYYAIGFYLPIIALTLFGESFPMATTGALVMNLFGVVGGVLSIWLAARYGFRRTVLTCYSLIIGALLVLGVFIDGLHVVLAVIVPAVFLLAQSAGPGGAGLTMTALAYPTELRARGGQFGTMVKAGGAVVGLFTFPLLREGPGTSWAILIFALAPVLGLIVTAAIRWEPMRAPGSRAASPDDADPALASGH